MKPLDFALDQTLILRAPPRVVFRYFTDSERFAQWWGKGSRIEAKVGGVVEIVYPNGVLAGGQVLELEPLRRIVFSYGYSSGVPIPLGASRVTICLQPHADGTLLELRHEVDSSLLRDQHIPGWRYQLAVFANVVADEGKDTLPNKIDRWFAAWNERDAERRAACLAEVASAEVAFHDQHACLAGLTVLNAHIQAAQQFFPDVRIERFGLVQHCQGFALSAWRVLQADGRQSGEGQNLFELDSEGRFRRVVGFWLRQ